PFRLTDAGLNVNVDVDYNRVKFGLRGDGTFFFESPDGKSAFTVTVSATPANPKGIQGTIGFFEMRAAPNPIADRPGKSGISLDARLVMDANGLALSPPKLAGSADVNLKLDARLSSNVGNATTFPHMTTDFIVHWDLAGAANARLESMGSAP